MTDIYAVDEGGPKRQFMDEIMNQMGDLVIKDAKNQMELKLFESFEVCLMPVTNDQLESTRGRGLEKKVKAFYRGIGRLFALCYLHREENGERNLLIAAKCLPSLYRNCKSKLFFSHKARCQRLTSYSAAVDLFRSVSPLDEDYKLSPLIDDAFAILNPYKNVTNVQDAKAYFDCETETEFREMVNTALIKTRIFALDALKEGITLNGKSISLYGGYNATIFNSFLLLTMTQGRFLRPALV